MNPEEYAAMQERENAIAQLEVQETALQREMREEEDRELAKLENDISTMAEVFVETQRLVNEQGEVVGKHPCSPLFSTDDSTSSPDVPVIFNFLTTNLMH